jgi:hypothetical protein
LSGIKCLVGGSGSGNCGIAAVISIRVVVVVVVVVVVAVSEAQEGAGPRRENFPKKPKSAKAPPGTCEGPNCQFVGGFGEKLE